MLKEITSLYLSVLAVMDLTSIYDPLEPEDNLFLMNTLAWLKPCHFKTGHVRLQIFTFDERTTSHLRTGWHGLKVAQKRVLLTNLN
jgi:hypothetical protein